MTRPKFRVRIKSLEQLLGLVKFSPVSRIEGYDVKNRLRVVFNMARGVLVLTNERGFVEDRWILEEDGPLTTFSRMLAMETFLTSLTWKCPGGWKGAPLELLALCADDE